MSDADELSRSPEPEASSEYESFSRYSLADPLHRSHSVRLYSGGQARVRLGAPRGLSAHESAEIVSHDEIAPVSPPPEAVPAAAAAAAAATVAASASKPEAVLDWIEIELRDESGNVVEDASYEIVLPDGSTREGKLSGGRLRLDEIPSGECTIKFPDLSSAVATAA